jgi:site-specific recombinase XerC
MINRQNYLDVRAYLRYCDQVRQNSPETVARNRAHLHHLLTWADSTPLPKSRQISPGFSNYILTARLDIPGKLSPSSIKKGLEAARGFFTFARDQWPQRYHAITATWIESLQSPRGSRIESHLVEHQAYTLADVLKIVRVPVETLRELRGQVAAAMLFLSGMRAGALATLPISCVDLAKREIRQLPELGVRTKNRKAAVTYLLDIPELLALVDRWDRLVRVNSPDSLWYATLTRDGMALTETTPAHAGRCDLVSRDLRPVCALAGVPYLSPHKLRHGFAVHALKLASNMSELKAISQNLMHSSVTITDSIYARLVNDDVRTIIGGLGKATPIPPDDRLDEILRLLRQQLQPAAV